MDSESFVQSRSSERIAERLEQLHRGDQWRSCVTLDSASGPHIEIDGKSYLHLCSNNYLGLAGHPDLAQAAAQAAQRWGTGAGSARLITGTSQLAEDFERDLAAFKGAESSLLFSSGYLANLGVVQALAAPGDWLICDELNHASLIDAARLARGSIQVHPHNELDAVRALLERAPEGVGKIILTEGVFSMDGDLAPLQALSSLAQEFDAWLVVDDAHGTGVLGPEGRGACAEAGISSDHLVQIVTLSKALGSQGGAVVGSKAVIDLVTNCARSFIFETALAAPSVGAAQAALRIVEADAPRRDRLTENMRLMQSGLHRLGFGRASDAPTPIFPIILGGNRETLDAAEALKAEGFWVTPIRPPTVASGTSRLRVTVRSDHAAEELERFLDSLGRILAL